MNTTEKVILALVVVAIVLLIAMYLRKNKHKEGLLNATARQCSGIRPCSDYTGIPARRACLAACSSASDNSPDA
jgi:hypothetical protein